MCCGPITPSRSTSCRQKQGLDHLEPPSVEAPSDRALEAEVETEVANGRVLAYLAQHAQIHQRVYSDERVRVFWRFAAPVPRSLVSNTAST